MSFLSLKVESILTVVKNGEVVVVGNSGGPLYLQCFYFTKKCKNNINCQASVVDI